MLCSCPALCAHWLLFVYWRGCGGLTEAVDDDAVPALRPRLAILKHNLFAHIYVVHGFTQECVVEMIIHAHAPPTGLRQPTPGIDISRDLSGCSATTAPAFVDCESS